MKTYPIQRAVCFVPLLLAVFWSSPSGQAQPPAPLSKQQRNRSGANNRDKLAAAAFERMVPVLRHPRCMNCHSTGDYPRQGDNRHPHTMDIRRGPDGHGLNVVKCSTCHQTENSAGLHAPPGADEWHLPPPDMPMIWEGRTNRQLCELLKDPSQNGHKTIQQIVEHMSTPLVLWGWHPGEGRTPVPGTADQFLTTVKSWAENGAACPTNRR